MNSLTPNAFNKTANKQFYDGYVRTSKKAAKHGFKDPSQRLSFQDTQELREFGGVLQSDIVMVDIDNEEASKLVLEMVQDLDLNCRVIKTTRGRHFLFRRGSLSRHATGAPCALGLLVDIKTGNRSSYEVIKFNGKVREIERVENGRVDVVPDFLQPIKGTPLFGEMEAGDGRNNALYGHILRLQGAGHSKKSIKQTLALINDYVLAEPMDDEELEVIMRDEAFSQTPPSKKGRKQKADTNNELPSFYRGKEFLFHILGDYLIEKHHIIKIGGQLHIYEDGLYYDAHGRLDTLILDTTIVNRSKRREVIEYINAVVTTSTELAPANLIAFENGILDIETSELLPFSPEIVLVNRIHCDYDESAEHDLMDKTLDKLTCNDRELRSILEEMVGYMWYRYSEMGKSFLLVGDRSNGKSTFLDIIKAMLGDENVSSLDINELGDRFSSAMLFGKLANIGDDIGDDFLQGAQVALFKKIVTGNRIKAERKGCDPFDFEPYAKLIFSANEIPRMRDKTGAVTRRLIIIPFNATFTREDPDYDPYIKRKLVTKKALSYLALLGVAGLKRVLEANGFTDSRVASEELRNYERENNPLLIFLDEYDRDEFIGKDVADMYRSYENFCEYNGFSPISAVHFSRQVNKRLGLMTSKRRVGRITRNFYVDDMSRKMGQK